MAGELGSLVVELAANLARFESDLGRANKMAQTHVDQMKATFGAVQTVISAVVGGAMAMYVKSLVDSAEELSKVSQRTGHAIGFLSELKFAAAQDGIAMGDLTGMLAKFNVSMTEASDKTSKQAMIFRALGVDITKGPTEALKQFGERAAAITDADVRTTIFKETLGKTGDVAIGLLKNLDESTAAARRMGATMAEETARNAERLNDAMTRLSESSKAMHTRALAPAVEGLASMAEEFEKATSKGQGLVGAMREIIRLGAATGGAAANFWGMPRVGAAAEGVFNAFQTKQPSGILEDIARRNGQMGANAGPQIPPNVLELRRIASGQATRDANEAAAKEKQRQERIRRQIAEGEEAWQEHSRKVNEEYARYLQGLDLESLAQYQRNREEMSESNRIFYEEGAELRNIQAEAEARDIRKQAEDRERFMTSYRRMVFEQADVTKRASDAARDLGMTFSSAFEDMLIKGASVREMLRGLAQDVLRIAARKMVTEPLALGLTTGLTSGLNRLFGGGGTTIDPSMIEAVEDFAGGKPNMAMGGPVVGGRAYQVGELGREWFVPDQGGSVVPSGKNGGGPNVFIDARGADMAGFARLERVIAQLNGSIEKRAIAAVMAKGLSRGVPVLG